MLYPLKFKPLFKEKIWGGDRIRTRLGFDFAPLPNCGEAWVLSGVPGDQTVVANGFLAGNDLNEILGVYMDELVGEKAWHAFPDEFPILVKFIDSNDYLSIQVHPGDELARKRNLGNGKTEMWYILDAEPGAEIISGFANEITPETYIELLGQKRLKEALHADRVSRGDVFFIPAGRVHALGPGILLAEIQQTSDVTYRIYDWDRVDAQGRSRELHTALALEAIDFSQTGSSRVACKRDPATPVTLVDCHAFTANMLNFSRKTEKDYSSLDSFVIYVCVEGSAAIRSGGETVPMTAGEVVLLPADTGNVFIRPEAGVKILEVYIP